MGHYLEELMPRDSRAALHAKLARGRRAFALARNEFRVASTERESAAGVTSFAVKTEDRKTRALIDAALERINNRAVENSGEVG